MIRSWRYVAVTLVVALTAPAFAQTTAVQIPSAPAVAETSIPPAAFAPIDTLINDAVAHNQIPGAVVVIGHDGHVVFHRAYGMRSLVPI